MWNGKWIMIPRGHADGTSTLRATPRCVYPKWWVERTVQWLFLQQESTTCANEDLYCLSLVKESFRVGSPQMYCVQYRGLDAIS